MKSSRLTEADVAHVAKLAKLTLTAAEVKKFQQQLSDILEYIVILNKISTQKLSPTSQVTGLENVYRPDKILTGLSQKETLQGSEKTQNNMFKTEAVF